MKVGINSSSFTVAAILLANSPVSAACLDEAATFAERICGEISNKGSSSTKTASGELTAEAKGLIRRIIGTASGEINGELLITSYENVLREQLPSELSNVRDCRMRMVEVARKEVCIKPLTYRSCRHPDFGQSGWVREEIIQGTSGWRGGGYNQNSWCDDVTRGAISSRKLGGLSYKVEKIDSSEEARWTGTFNRDRQYNYHCRVKIFWEPVYNEKIDPRCGAQN